MKQTICLFLIIVSLQTFAQSKVDTLFIGKNKTILKRVKPFHSISQEGPVQLASEYAEIDNRVQIQFNYWNDTSYTTLYEDQETSGGQITLTRVDLPSNKNTLSNLTYTMSRFVDTIIVEAKMLGNLQVFIKSNGRKIYFCAAKIVELKNGIMQEYANTFAPNGYILNYYSFPEASSEEIERRKSTTYILTDLYYIKGNATYYLDRQYVILAK